VSRPPKWALAGAWRWISSAWGSSGPRHRPHSGPSRAHGGIGSVRGGGLAGIRKSDRMQLHKLTGLGGWLTAECGFDAARRLVRVIEAQAAVAGPRSTTGSGAATLKIVLCSRVVGEGTRSEQRVWSAPTQSRTPRYRKSPAASPRAAV
jgi:hypothetical protein